MLLTTDFCWNLRRRVRLGLTLFNTLGIEDLESEGRFEALPVPICFVIGKSRSSIVIVA